MAKNIERQIRFKAVIIYLIVALGIVAIILYFNNLRDDISSQRHEIENQYSLLSVTNDLMLSVNDALSLASLYVSSNNRKYLNEYARSIDSIEAIISVIVERKPNEEEKLSRIVHLLKEQLQNIKKLNLQFTARNPIELINERLKEYEHHPKEDTVYIFNIQRDTVVIESTRRGFFRRFADLFNPSVDSVKYVVNQQTDTVRVVKSDSLALIYEVGEIALKAMETYEQNMKTIERQVGALLSSNNNIATEVSALLFEFYQETLHSTLELIHNSEQVIQENYFYSTIGGVLAMGIILFFILLIITDINKGRRIRRALEVANDRNRQIMESRHKLLLSVSHDIKTPLNSVMGYLSLMKSDPNVRSMQSSSEHILLMLENLLEFSSLEQGTLQKNVTDFNLKELFESIYNMFLPLAEQKALSLSFTAEEVRIRTDGVKLKQIVINLVSNAIKYTKVGQVAFTATWNEHELRVVVSDTGVGIPAEKLPRLFLPFVRIEENSTIAEGTGLGLFVVRGLVELLGGEIAIHSKVEEGTTIDVKITAERALKEIPRGVKKIKVYDDDPIVVKMVSDLLIRLGHKVVEQDYDLVITDMEMGAISGLDILHQVAGAVPVVMMTGRADFTAQKAMELGFDHFLAKPITISSLREIVGDGESLSDFFADNSEEIMLLFQTSSRENMVILQQALDDDNFEQAQAICHKMYPVFAQMGYPSQELGKMDAHRSGPYKGWQVDVKKIVSIKL